MIKVGETGQTFLCMTKPELSQWAKAHDWLLVIETRYDELNSVRHYLTPSGLDLEWEMDDDPDGVVFYQGQRR